ncbi:MAG: SLC13 family permease [Alphaproteobacteria bacterium]|nr:SLC13 family permease [Alphaproteobacteria bacterium]
MGGPGRLARLIAAALVVIAVALWFTPPPEGANPLALKAAAIVLVSVGLWSTAALPEYLAAIIFFLLAVATGVAPAAVVFSGFHSGAVWVIFGGLVIGVAVQATGLGVRLACRLVGLFQGSYLGIITGVVMVGVALGFVVPSSTGRVVILMPIVMALADRLGFVSGTTGRIGMALAVGAGTLLPTFAILPAAVPNLGLVGAAESIYGIHITYGTWLKTHFPVIGLLPIIVLPVLIARLFPDTARPPDRGEAIAPPGARETRLAVVLVAALLLWITDFLHGIAPAWVAMAAAVMILLPRIGVLPPTTLVERVNYGPWFFVAGVVGIGAFVTHTGLGALLAERILAAGALQRGADFANYLIIVAFGMGMGLVASMPGQPGIMVPLAGGLAEATGWPVYDVLMAIVASWPLVLFPYELPPVVVACHLGGVRFATAARVLTLFTAIAWVVLVPLQYLWLRLLGLLGG